MALIFPFDSTLKGYVEEVEINISNLEYPIFTFPKGSFFVSELYGIVKGTRTIVRPGLDFKVLSLNETIQFNDSDTNLNTTLKQNYVRNGILWCGRQDVGTIVWKVPYCGGEDSNKPAQYSNYIATLYNQARTLGTINLYGIKQQAWGGFIHPENKQIVSGRDIYNKYFDYYEDINNNGGLGWGKVHLSMMALAEVVANGGDPMEIQAFYDWLRKYEIEYTKYKDSIVANLNQQIENLDQKRVGFEQFVYSNGNYNHYSKHNYKELNNVILRGLDPDETGFQLNPIKTNRNNVGHYALGVWGNDFDLKATRLSQRKSIAIDTSPFKISITYVKQTTSGSNPRNIQYGVKFENIEKASSGVYTAYIISKRLGVIATLDVSRYITGLSGSSTIGTSAQYPGGSTDYADDIIFIFVANENMQTDFMAEVGRLRYISYTRNYGYTLSVDTRGLIITNGELISKNPELDLTQDNAIGTSSVEVTITRQFSDYVETNYLAAVDVKDIGSAINNTVNAMATINWAAGETKKIVKVSNSDGLFTRDTTVAIQLHRTNQVNVPIATRQILATVLVGQRKSTTNNVAYIELLDSEENGNPVTLPKDGTRYYLSVQYAKNFNFHRVNPTLKVANIVGNPGNVLMGTPKFIDVGHVIYPIQFLDFKPTAGLNYFETSLELVDPNSSFSTNRINLYIAHQSVNFAGAGTFNLVEFLTVEAIGGVITTFRYRPTNLGVIPNLTAFNLSLSNNATVVNPPIYLNDQLEFSFFTPDASIGKPVNIEVSYVNASGQSVTVVNMVNTYNFRGARLDFISPSNMAIINRPRLGEPFKIRYRGEFNVTPTKVSVSIDTTMSDRNNVNWSGDAPDLQNPTLSGVVVASDKTAWVNAGTQISVAEVINTTTYQDYAKVYFKVVSEFPDGTTNVSLVMKEFLIESFDIKFYRLGSNEEITDGVFVSGTSAIMSVTSKTIDLSSINYVTIYGSGFVYKNLIVDATNNTVKAVFDITTVSDGPFSPKISIGGYEVYERKQFRIVAA